MIVDGRKKRGERIKRKNLDIIIDWLEKNPGSSISDCVKGTGLTYPTVKRYVDMILIEAYKDE
jgi:predicted transcriptional regulator